MSHAYKCCECFRNVINVDLIVNRLQALNARVDVLMYKNVVIFMNLIYDAIERVKYHEVFEKSRI